MALSKLNIIERSVAEISLASKAMSFACLCILLLCFVGYMEGFATNIFYACLFFSLTCVLFISLGTSLMKRQVATLIQNVSQLTGKENSQQLNTLTSKDELGQLTRTIFVTLEKLHHIIKEKDEGASELREITENLSLCMEMITDAVGEEVSQIDQVATAMNQMTNTVKEIAENADNTSVSTEEAFKVAERGNEYITNIITIINSLSNNIDESSKAVVNVETNVAGIGAVVDTIRSISEQTNLLALNAAIEAARAGDAGRGFSVVADEVRNLAQRTQVATVEIQKMIEQLGSSAQNAVSLMEQSVTDANFGAKEIAQAGDTLSSIVEKVGHISQLNSQIALSSKEQATVATEINENLEQVKEVVQGSFIVIQEVTEMTDTITKLVTD